MPEIEEHELPETVQKVMRNYLRTIEKIQDQAAGAIALYCGMEGISEKNWSLSPDGTKLISQKKE